MRRWKPMMASNGSEALLTAPDHLFEPKLDGIRALLYVEDDRVALFSRNGLDVTAAYPELDLADVFAASQCVIDGEIVLYDAAGNPDFHTLVRRHQRGVPPRGGRPVTFAAFDVLHADGADLVDEPIEIRKEQLHVIVPEAHPRIQPTVHTSDGERLWRFMLDRGQEGVIAKRIGSRYEPGRRSAAWQKIKIFRTIDAVIVGFRSDRRPVSSLALGLYDDEDALHGIGRVGTGFSDVMSRRLRSMLGAHRVESRPVESMPDDPGDIIWTEPRYVCEVRYLAYGPNGALRHPSFLRLRPDKDPQECRLETQRP